MCDILDQRNKELDGYLNRLEDSRLPKQILDLQLAEGSRKTSKLNLGYKDILKRNMGLLNIPLDKWQYLSTNRKT